MTKKPLIILTVIVIACAGGVLAQRSRGQQADASNVTRWEYGVYRGRVYRNGEYLWSWQDAKGRFYRSHLRQFLTEMGLDQKAVDAAPDSEADTLELDLLNALGEKGWELFWTRQEKDGSWFFLFKRPKLPATAPSPQR